MRAVKPAVFNIESGQCFADTLALGLLERADHDPLALSAALVLLPNRRACRTLRDAFLRLSEGRAVLLPRLQPLGEADADEISLLSAGADETLDIPPAIRPLERQMILAQMILKAKQAETFDQAAALAQALGEFLDEVQTERLGFEGLRNLVPDMFAAHWQETLEFLKILTAHWPEILKSRGVIDSAERRNLLLGAEMRAWEKNPPPYPVIAAGSTGPSPAVADMLHVIARLPQGMVVLPGLDRHLDDESWGLLTEDHPQYNMKKLLEKMDVPRDSVKRWEMKKKIHVNHARVNLISEALRPAATTERWRGLTEKTIPPDALDGLSRIDCDTPQEEAEVIALIMREALETPEKTAALITPDRQLAQRVARALLRWGIAIDDSGGTPLTALPAGSWLTLTAEMAREKLSPVALLSCLKHPLMAAAMPPGELRGMTYLLDRLVLRGPRPSPGFGGLRAMMETVSGDDAHDGKKLLAWAAKIEKYMAPFVDLMSGGEKPFRDLLTAHIRMAESLAATLDLPGGARLWSHEAGEAGSAYLGDLLSSASDVPALSPDHYAALLGLLLKTVTVRPRYGTHPRLSILGQIEARLFCANLVIVGGLNEGTWPASPGHDPWMSRPMRQKFGLPAPERNTGIAAHDFFLAATSCEAVLTRSRRMDGAPTVPARWLLRIDTVLKALHMDWPQTPYRDWARDLDLPGTVKAAPRPTPRPPAVSRPRKLSVTQIERWMRDPYQIYAEKILRLKALDEIDADPGGAERGTFIHKALERFVRDYPEDLPPDAAATLLKLGREEMENMRVPREVEAFWWPRFEEIARGFTEQERAWRARARSVAAETEGAWTFDARGGPFTLTAKADRVDRFTDGTYAVIDYKSGIVPGNAEVAAGLSPQLPLEAAMIAAGAFPGIPAGEVSELVYWRVAGGGQKPVEQKIIRSDAVPQLAAGAEAGLKNLVAAFDDETTPYLSRPRESAKARHSDYDHLARVKEWGVAGDEGEEE